WATTVTTPVAVAGSPPDQRDRAPPGRPFVHAPRDTWVTRDRDRGVPSAAVRRTHQERVGYRHRSGYRHGSHHPGRRDPRQGRPEPCSGVASELCGGPGGAFPGPGSASSCTAVLGAVAHQGAGDAHTPFEEDHRGGRSAG